MSNLSMEDKNEVDQSQPDNRQTSKQCRDGDEIEDRELTPEERWGLPLACNACQVNRGKLAKCQASLEDARKEMERKDASHVAQLKEKDAIIHRLKENLKVEQENRVLLETQLSETMTRTFRLSSPDHDPEEHLGRSSDDNNHGQTTSLRKESTPEECAYPLEASSSNSVVVADDASTLKLLHQRTSSDTYNLSVCQNVTRPSGPCAVSKEQLIGKYGNVATSRDNMQLCCTPHLHLNQLGFEEKGRLIEKEHGRHKQEKCFKIKQVLSVIDFDAFKEIPDGIYRNVNDIKTSSACPCLCLAVLLNKLLVDCGHPPWFDSTLTIKVLSIITKRKESLLRQLFCSPETEDGADAFNDLLYLIEEVVARRFQEAVKLEHLNKAVERFVIDKIPRQGEHKQINCYILGLGYEHGRVGHCIDFFVKNNKLIPLDAQKGGLCHPRIFEGVNDIRVFGLRKEFESHFSSLFRREKLSKTDFMDIFEKMCGNL